MLALIMLAIASCAPFTATPPAQPEGTAAATGAPANTQTPTATSGAPAAGVALFAGTVKHAGQSVANARVELRALGWATNKTPAVATIQADSQGNFSLANPPVGDFSVVGYFADGEMDAGGWPPVSIAAGQQITGFVVPLERKLILLSPIAGSVVTSTLTLSWNPAAGVSEYRVWIIDAGTTEMKLDATTKETTIEGPAGLPAGEYQWVVNGLDAAGQLVATGQETFMFRANGAETPEPTNQATPSAMPRLPDRERAFAAAREALAQRLGVDPLAIQQVEVTPVEWPDACLGIRSAGQMCAQVITPGWTVILEAAGRRYEAHTDQEGLRVRFVGLK